MYKNILIPIALDHEHDTAYAIDIARKLLDEGGNLPENYKENQLSVVTKELQTVLEGVSDVTAAVVTGHAGRTITDYAEQHECDCIIVASHRPGMIDHFMGSTAAWVVRHARCAVHVTK